MISSQSKTAFSSAKTDKLYFWKCCQLLFSDAAMLPLPRAEDECTSHQPKSRYSHFFVCVCVFRDATGERCWDDVPLCHLHLHKAASRGSFGLQRSIPEGTHIYSSISLKSLYHCQVSSPFNVSLLSLHSSVLIFLPVTAFFFL